MSAELVALGGASALFGLLGSGHCAAMCGGIAGALALRAPGAASVFAQHAGRLAAYAALGAAAGAVALLGGAGGALDLAVRGLRAAAALLVASVGLALLLDARPWDGPARFGMAAWRAVFGRLAPSTAGGRGPGGAFATGLAWGWLPCGMSWTAAAAAVGAGPRSGALAMLAFGLGTLVATLPFSFAAARLGAWRAHPRVRQATGLALLALALVMLWAAWRATGEAGHAAHGR